MIATSSSFDHARVPQRSHQHIPNGRILQRAGSGCDKSTDVIHVGELRVDVRADFDGEVLQRLVRVVAAC